MLIVGSIPHWAWRDFAPLFGNENKANDHTQQYLSKIKNKILTTCLQVNYRESLEEFSSQYFTWHLELEYQNELLILADLLILLTINISYNI